MSSRGREIGTTRRGFLAGAGAGAAVQLLPAGLHAVGAFAADARPCAPQPPGSRTMGIAATPTGSRAWTTDSAARTIREHTGKDLAPGRALDVGGAPIAIAVSRAASRALVVTAAYDRPGLAFADLRTWRLADRVDVGKDPVAVAVSDDGRTAVVAGGGTNGTLSRVDTRTGRVHPPVAVGRHPRAVALSPDATHAYVTVNGDAQVAVVDLKRNRVVQRLRTAAFPSRIAIAPDGRLALVTHDGDGADRVTPIDLAHRRVRPTIRAVPDPGGVAFARRGRMAVVAGSGDGTVAVIDPRTRRVRKRKRIEGRPRAVVGTTRGAILADLETGALRRI